MQLASRFASRSPVLRSEHPLSDDQIRAVAPSIFADAPHESRSERYSYIPTATVLRELRSEGEREAKRDASCMIFLLTKRGLLFTPHTGFLDSEPSLSAVRCGWHEEPGWPCCHRLS